MLWQPGQTLDDIEKEVILKAIKFYGGNKTRTASSLGIAVRTLDNKLAIYNEVKNDVSETQAAAGSNDRAEAVERNEVETVSGVCAEGGLHVEPAPKATEKRHMPMRKR